MELRINRVRIKRSRPVYEITLACYFFLGSHRICHQVFLKIGWIFSVSCKMYMYKKFKVVRRLQLIPADVVFESNNQYWCRQWGWRVHTLGSLDHLWTLSTASLVSVLSYHCHRLGLTGNEQSWCDSTLIFRRQFC